MSFGDVTELGRVEDNVASSFTYNASLNDKVAMSLSANWNRISSPERHTYMYNGLAGESIRYSKTKDYSFQNVDFTFDAADNVSLNFGLNNIYNRYRINDGGTTGIGFDRKSMRFDTYGYATWNVRRDLSLRGGISAGYVNDDVTDKFYVAPQLSLTYYPDSFSECQQYMALNHHIRHERNSILFLVRQVKTFMCEVIRNCLQFRLPTLYFCRWSFGII